MFRFADPHMLWLLAAIPLLAALYWLASRNRARRLGRFGQESTVRVLIPDASAGRRRNKFILYLSAFALLTLALARPQTGAKLKEVTTEGMEIMFAIDVSNSMLARDFEPMRLERTKYAIGRLLEDMTTDKVGIVVFAGDAYVQLPVTSDYLIARNFVRQVSTDMVSKQGTAIGAAINLSAASFSSQSEGSRAIILISDGENHEDDAVAAANAAAAGGIKIYTIGIGTPEGAPIEIGNDFIRDEEGNIVVSKLDEATLEQVALLTGGAYIRSTNQNMGLGEIVERIRETEKTTLTRQIFDEYYEHYRIPLAAAILLLLLDFIILERKSRVLARFDIFGRKKSATGDL